MGSRSFRITETNAATNRRRSTSSSPLPDLEPESNVHRRELAGEVLEHERQRHALDARARVAHSAHHLRSRPRARRADRLEPLCAAGDAQRARAEAADLIRKNELLRSSSTSDDAAVSALASSLKADVALLRDQLEHVTAAYVEQGNALHRARMRWRIAHTRESPETAAAVAAEVAAEEAEEQAARVDAIRRLREAASRAREQSQMRREAEAAANGAAKTNVGDDADDSESDDEAFAEESLMDWRAKML